jgi:hypothetical protein
VGGQFTTLGGQPRSRLGRLNADGTLDASFDPGADLEVYTLAVQADGKILAGGIFTTLGGRPRNYLGRLNADGSLDSTFDPQADGTVVSLALQADGKVLAGGGFSTLVGELHNTIGRLNDGTASPPTLAIDEGGTMATWSGNVAGPELAQVTFELSMNGSSYAPLASPTRVPGGWQLAGLSLPTGQSFYLRARGRPTGGEFNGSGGLIETVSQLFRPGPVILRLTALPAVGNSPFQFTFPNPAAISYTVIATENVGLPLSSWTVLGAPVAIGGGVYQFTDTDSVNHPRRFYELRAP